MPPFTVHALDLSNPAHLDALTLLLDEYARTPEGGAEALAPAVLAALPDALAARPHYAGWVAFVDGRPAGLVNCFEGFSTFRGKPLMNVHDIIVSAPFRRRGIGRALLDAVEHEARRRGCCKITLEVLEGNTGAVAAYLQHGFAPYALDPAMGRAQFFEKKFY